MPWKSSVLTVVATSCLTMGLMLVLCASRELSSRELRAITAGDGVIEGLCWRVKAKGSCDCWNNTTVPGGEDYWQCGPSHTPNLLCLPLEWYCSPSKGTYSCNNLPPCITKSDCTVVFCFAGDTCSGTSGVCK